VGEERIKAHKSILAARSDTFDKLFQTHTDGSPGGDVVRITDFDSTAVGICVIGCSIMV